MAYHELKPEIRKLTSKLAAEFASMTTIEDDREISNNRIEYHRRNIANGTFHSPEWAKCFCKQNGVTYRVNGKHTSNIFTTDEIPSGLNVCIKTFEADSLLDVSVLYTMFDTPDGAKSNGDLTKAIISTEESLRKLPTKFKNDVTKAITFSTLQEKMRYNSNVRDRAKDALDPENVKFILWLKEHLYDGGSGKKHIWRSPVMAAIYLTYQRSQKDSVTFWSQVRDETGSKPTMPCRKLARWLGNTTLYNKPGLANEFFVRSLHAWNAFRNGDLEDPPMNYYKNSKLPKVI